MSMESIARELLVANGFDDWEVVDDAVLACPDGYPVEWDGECPDGHVSPLRTLGLI